MLNQEDIVCMLCFFYYIDYQCFNIFHFEFFILNFYLTPKHQPLCLESNFYHTVLPYV